PSTVAKSLGSTLYVLLSRPARKRPLRYVTSATRRPIGAYKERTCGNNSELFPAEAEKTNSFVATPFGDLRFFFCGTVARLAVATVSSEYTGDTGNDNCELINKSVDIAKLSP